MAGPLCGGTCRQFLSAIGARALSPSLCVNWRRVRGALAAAVAQWHLPPVARGGMQ
jgi:hypothetical protein